MSQERQHLIFAIIRYLEKQAKAGDLKEEDVESLEVASQCLETAFGLDQQSKDDLSTKFPLPADLLEIFKTGLQHVEHPAKEVSAADKEAADKLKAEGNECMKTEKTSEAINCYTKAIELDGTNPVYYCNRAAAYNKISKFEHAIEDCNAALQLDSQYSKAYNRRGVAQMSLQQYQEAKESFNKALELDPNNDGYKTSLEQAEQRLQDAQTRGVGASMGGAGPGGLGGLNLGGINLPAMLNNPALMNMAQNMMSNPAMQQMMANVMMGAQGQEGQEGLSSLLQAGQHLAQEVQTRNPELVEQLRQQMRQGDQDPGTQPDTANKPDGTEGSR